jgi:hypothetical protein
LKFAPRCLALFHFAELNRATSRSILDHFSSEVLHLCLFELIMHIGSAEGACRISDDAVESHAPSRRRRPSVGVVNIEAEANPQQYTLLYKGVASIHLLRAHISELQHHALSIIFRVLVPGCPNLSSYIFQRGASTLWRRGSLKFSDSFTPTIPDC